MGRGARAIPDRLLREADRWPHRRSTRWLEGTRPLDDIGEPNTVAHRRREGHAAEGVQVPDASGSTGALIGWWLVVGGWWLVAGGGRNATANCRPANRPPTAHCLLPTSHGG